MHAARRLVRSYLGTYSGIPSEVWVLAAATVVNRAGTMVLPFLSLYLTRHLGYSAAEAGSVVALYGVGAMAGSILGGWLSDRLGAIRVQELSFVLTAVGFLVLMHLREPAAVAVGVAAVATVAEAFRPALMAAAVGLAGPASRVRALALIRLATNLGMAVGPAAGGALALVSYPLLFVADAATCCGAAVVLRLTLHRRERLRVGHLPEQHEDGNAWRRPGFLVFLLLVLLLAMAFFQVFTTIPLYLVAVYGMTEAGVGALLALNAGLIVLLEMPLLKLVEHRPHLRVAAVGSLLVCGGLATLGFDGGTALAVAAIVIWTVGEMLALPMTNAAAAEWAPAHAGGRVMGAYALAFSAALVVGPALGSAVYEHLGGHVLLAGMALTGVVLLGGFLALDRWTGPNNLHAESRSPG